MAERALPGEPPVQASRPRRCRTNRATAASLKEGYDAKALRARAKPGRARWEAAQGTLSFLATGCFWTVYNALCAALENDAGRT